MEEYLNARVYGPDSGIYQLFELPHHFQSHSCFVMKLSFPGREHVRFNPAHGERRVMEGAAARQQCNHTQQYLSANAQEARMLFRPTQSELQATARLGCATVDGQATAGQGTTAANGRAPTAPHQPRVRATPAEELAELQRRATEASKPHRGAWAYRVLGVMRDASGAVLKQANPDRHPNHIEP